MTTNPTRQVVLYVSVAFLIFLASGGSLQRLQRSAKGLQ